MAPPSPPKNPVRRPPGRSLTRDTSQSSVAPQSVAYQPCPPSAFTLPDAPQRPTEPQSVQQPHPTTDFQSFATGEFSFGDYYSFDTAFDYTGDLESANLDLTQPFPALGFPSTVHPAVDTTPIDPQLSSGGHQTSISTQITPAQTQASPTTNPAISSTSQVPAQEQSQPTVEERVLTLPSTTAQTPSQAAPPAESTSVPTSVPEGPSEQPPPATGKRVQKAQPKKSRKRNVDQVDVQSSAGPAVKKRATDKSKEASKDQAQEQPKGQTKNPLKRKADQVDGQSATGPAAKNKAAGTPEKQSVEQTLAALSDAQVPQVISRLKQNRQSRRSRWTQAVADTVEHNQAEAEALIDNFKPIEPQPATPVVDLTGEGPAENQLAEKQPARDQSTGEQSAMDRPTMDQPTMDQPTMNQPTMNQPQNIPAQIQDPAIRPPGYYADKDVRRKIKVGGVTLSRAGLGLPHFLNRDQIHCRISFIDEEIQNQKGKAPILPPSELAQPDPKPFTPKAYNVPVSIKDPRVRHFFDKKNHDLCTKNKKIDLDRNNQAAKGTRSRREEALDKHRELANEMAIELNWWRIKAISLGAHFREWDHVPETVKRNMAKEMTERVEKLEAAAAKEAKKQRSTIHSARTKENARLSKEDEARKKKEILEVAAAYAAGDHALIEKMADPNYQALLPKSSSAAAGRNTTANGQNSNRKKRATVADQDTETSTAADVTAAVTTEDVAETTNNTGLTNTIAPDTMASDTMDFGSMEFGSMEFDNIPPADNATSYSMPSGDMPPGSISPYAMPPGNTIRFDNGAHVNTSIAPAQFNMTSAPIYGGPSVEIQTYPNTQNNAFGNAQTQQQQSSDFPQGTNNGHELRRQPSNVTMFDAEHEAMQPLDPNMGTMMDETSPYWEVTNAPSSSTLTSNVDSFQGPMGDVSTLPPNTMSHSVHGPTGSPHMLLPNICQNSDNLANGVSWYSEPEALVNAFLPSLQKDQDQKESTTNDKGSTDQVGANANTSAYPDPAEESYMSRYLNLSP
ncbi:hypothetical protein FVEN_g11160 [Fusarium venenatum]|uniref:Uncharacterized protein n=1 Tax=Fusarium venenatum TaxID=56646 RepID=A0A2L2TCZ7_9HYPO|nr:uncharacterized protein FVRRES_08929 [Fusarium venenatum]KAG8350723.1 hypothetical protein FVEN_g11160 [Fusarium venenatum]KAH6965657.1 hypothetical protein EDB82DRAFT_579330 [Fusarium venenatum]CEI68852.1 unnamed protein product [Fusarium venenatum]